MREEVNMKLGELKSYLKNIYYLNHAMSLLGWDTRVTMPRKGNDERGEVLGYLSLEGYKLRTSPQIKGFIDFFEKEKDLDDVTKVIIKKIKKSYDKMTKIPGEKNKEWVISTSKSEAAWEDAKDKGDFHIFKPHLQEMINISKEFAEYIKEDDKKSNYEVLLDEFEPGNTIESLDNVFTDLKEGILDILNKIKNSNINIDDSILKVSVKKADQEAFVTHVLEKLGYDFKGGRMDESVHPFTLTVGSGDVRITTRYIENDFTNAFFSCVHEGGHAIYEQDIPNTLKYTYLDTASSMGIHESQSRFYENIIARSESFWTYYFKEVQQRFPHLKDVSLDNFYNAINKVKPSLIRVDADELTYSLHVIIRYEIEKMLIDGDLNVEDLPKVWNEKYKEYLGIEPKDDREGVLQDMHWSGRIFGYFPSYALGNLYGAQFLNKMLKDMPDMYERIEEGEFSHIHKWLNDNIHAHGSIYEPSELIKIVTGEELNSKYFLKYLRDKYSKVYNINL